ncbi:hypothetical protein GCM10009561_01860 [Frigoribacterium faeni]
MRTTKPSCVRWMDPTVPEGPMATQVCRVVVWSLIVERLSLEGVGTRSRVDGQVASTYLAYDLRILLTFGSATARQ